MSNVSIRMANRDDAELIADMSRTSFYEAFAKDNTKEDMDIFLNEQFTKDALMKEVKEEDGIFILAFADELPVGYARLRLHNQENKLAGENAIELARIYALPNAIGKGVGGALMQKCIDIALNLEKKILWLGVWEKNERAIAFYKRWGFEKFNEHAFLLGNDLQTDWLMRRPVHS